MEKLLERTDGSNTSSVGQIEGRKGTDLAKRLYCVFLYGWHVTSWTWREMENGDQVILQSTAYIMPERRAARIHLFLPTALGSRGNRTVPALPGPTYLEHEVPDFEPRLTVAFCFLAICSAEWAFHASHQRISTI